MSGVSGLTPYGLMGLLIANSDQVNTRLGTLTEQSSSGLVSQNYAGLGDAGQVALHLQPQIARQQAISTDIQGATGQMSVAQTALKQVSSLVAGVVAQLNTLNNLDSTTIASVASSAQSALQQVAGLLDTQDGGIYVFAGQDSANAPVPNPDQITASGFYTQIGAAVSGLGASATTTISTTLTIASSTAAGTSPFSATLEQLAAATPDGRASVQTGQGQNGGQSVPGIMLASRNGDVASTGTSTTGSYMRDILRGLATVAAFTTATGNAGGFQALVQDTRTSLNAAISSLNADAGVLGDRQTSLTTTATTLDDTATALTAQVSNVEDVDLGKTASELSLVQTQLQASYKLIAGLGDLSLVKFL